MLCLKPVLGQHNSGSKSRFTYILEHIIAWNKRVVMWLAKTQRYVIQADLLLLSASADPCSTWSIFRLATSGNLAAVLGLWESIQNLIMVLRQSCLLFKKMINVTSSVMAWTMPLLKIATESHINNSPGIFGGASNATWSVLNLILNYLRHSRRILRRVREIQTSISCRHRSGISLGPLVFSI